MGVFHDHNLTQAHARTDELRDSLVAMSREYVDVYNKTGACRSAICGERVKAGVGRAYTPVSRRGTDASASCCPRRRRGWCLRWRFPHGGTAPVRVQYRACGDTRVCVAL